jgi:sulfur dioxygenase
MLFKQLFDKDTSTYTYILADSDTREAVIIDPVIEYVNRDLALISELGLELIYTLDTHIHADHITGSGEVRRQTNALSGVSILAKVDCIDCQLSHGDLIHFGQYVLEVRSTPGHTNGCLTFVIEADHQMMAFTGDALLIRGCGRTDFQQGDSATLYHSIHEQIYTLPDHTVIYPGHDYKGHTSSTVAEEKVHNPRLKTKVNQSYFMQIMKNLKLNPPKKIHEALPANLTCGIKDSTLPHSTPAHKEINVSSLEYLNDEILVDVRTLEEFESEQGHIQSACSIPLFELTDRVKTWQRDLPIVVICRSGKRSFQACSLLTQMNFTNVTNVLGGMNAYLTQSQNKET